MNNKKIQKDDLTNIDITPNDNIIYYTDVSESINSTLTYQEANNNINTYYIFNLPRSYKLTFQIPEGQMIYHPLYRSKLFFNNGIYIGSSSDIPYSLAKFIFYTIDNFDKNTDPNTWILKDVTSNVSINFEANNNEVVVGPYHNQNTIIAIRAYHELDDPFSDPWNPSTPQQNNFPIDYIIDYQLDCFWNTLQPSQEVYYFLCGNNS